VDVVVVFIVIRISWIAAKNGLPVELFKLSGTLGATYVAMHYYTALSDWLGRLVPVSQEMTPLEFMDFVAFGILAVAVYLVLVLLRSIFYRWIKMEAVPAINKWGGFILGLGRAYLFLGLVIFMLAISSIAYLKDSVRESYFGRRIFEITPATYSWLWNNLGSKFMPKEKFNHTVIEVQDDFK